MYANLFPASSLLIMITIIISILIQSSLLSCQEDSQYDATCKESFQCANLEDLGYPFWGGSRPESCGHQGFRLFCGSDVPEITIDSRSYGVLAIDSSTQTLTVARGDLLTSQCPSSTNLYNTTLDLTLFGYDPGDQNVTLHYGCSAPNPAQTLLNGLICPLNGVTTYGYFTIKDMPNFNSSLLLTCSNKIIVPVNGSSYLALTRPTASIYDLQAALAGGFVLQYLATSFANCKQCVDSDGVCGQNTTTNSFACYCADGPHSLTCGNDQNRAVSRKNLWRKIILGGSAFLFGIITLAVTLICYHKQRCLSVSTMLLNKEKEHDQNVEAFIRNYGSLNPKRYSYVDIKRMTNSFTEKLGQGGYGSVYMGKLPDGGLVAVKILSEAKGDGEEFINEVSSISRTSHVNIVTLLGFCYQRNKRALIYEFMPKGSLDRFIYNDGSLNTNCRLEWKTMYQISVGIARGLEYLHQGCKTRIVHFDIKPQNILLDNDFCPKISDFGLAKLCQRKESIISVLGARGTVGYIAPEVFCRNFGAVSHKSDVYSYGMMVLEMAGARKRINFGDAQSSEIYFPDCIYEHLKHSEDLRVNGVLTEEEEETSRKLILVGLWCIQTNPSDRPSISKVIEMLEGGVQSLQIPPKPLLLTPKRSPPEISASLP